MSEQRFTARRSSDSAYWTVYDEQFRPACVCHVLYPEDYPGGPQAAAEAEAARLNAWWEAEQEKKKWRPSSLYLHGIDDSSGGVRVTCYDGHGSPDLSLATRILRLLNEDEARTK